MIRSIRQGTKGIKTIHDAVCHPHKCHAATQTAACMVLSEQAGLNRARVTIPHVAARACVNLKVKVSIFRVPDSPQCRPKHEPG